MEISNVNQKHNVMSVNEMRRYILCASYSAKCICA